LRRSRKGEGEGERRGEERRVDDWGLGRAQSITAVVIKR
jgi:hypothetical protein